MINKKRILSLAEELLSDDLFLVDLEVASGNKITVVIDSLKGVDIGTCVTMSRQIEKNLDREEEDFELQVYSAGLDQPFKVHKQYIKNIGREIEVKLEAGGKHEGVLQTVEDDHIVLKTQRKERVEGKKKKITIEEDLTFQLEDIKTAKVIISFK